MALLDRPERDDQIAVRGDVAQKPAERVTHVQAGTVSPCDDRQQARTAQLLRMVDRESRKTRIHLHDGAKRTRADGRVGGDRGGWGRNRRGRCEHGPSAQRHDKQDANGPSQHSPSP